MMKRLAILGSSGHGRVVADAALCAGWQETVFFDDSLPDRDSKALFASATKFDGVIVAIGDNTTRLEKTRALADAGAVLATVIHPSAVVARSVTLGDGTVVCAGAVINVDARVGLACIVNTGATVDHDCSLGSGTHVGPGANLGGGVACGDRVWIGIGAAVTHNASIGDDAIVGGGAMVIRTVEPSMTVVGVPARPC